MARQRRHLVGKQVSIGRDVLSVARERVREALKICDTPVVSFSGGKDSTVVLNLVLEEAAAMRRLPVDVFFADEEIVAPETIEYVQRVARRRSVRLFWSCIPLRHRNACSKKQPWWYTWNPKERELWIREMPAKACRAESYPFVPWTTIQEQTQTLFSARRGSVVQFLGRRTQESLTRFRMIALRRGEFAFLSRNPQTHMRWADPIYDWKASDVWTAIKTCGWDHNEAYDLFSALGIPASQQRLAPPYGEEPSRQLWVWQRCWPEMWDRMQHRVFGADAGKRYTRTGVYAYRDNTLLGPQRGETWKKYIDRLLCAWPEEKDRAATRRGIEGLWRHHAINSPGDPIPVNKPHPITGICWAEIAQIAWRGYLKRRSLTQKIYGTMRKKSKGLKRRSSKCKKASKNSRSQM